MLPHPSRLLTANIALRNGLVKEQSGPCLWPYPARMYFCGASCNFSFFISDFIDLGPLSFFLDESDWRFINFVCLFKEQAVSFIDLFYCFSVRISFISAMIFMIIFPSTNFGFCLFFFKYEVRLFIGDFLLFPKVACITINFRLRTAFSASRSFWIVVLLFSFVFRFLKNFSFDFFSDPLVV